jgi:ubiquinone/menaquinone biosynthesis C-methylase UbiE
MNKPIFTAHNILLDNGEYTKPEIPISIDAEPWMKSASKILKLVFPNKNNENPIKIVDLGCLEGGHSVEFARMGFETLGIEVRDSNFNCCEYVLNKVNLPNLKFVKDDVLNISKYDDFDASFCCGLLYHLDRPKYFLEELAKKTKKLIIIQTHFSIVDNKPTRWKLSELTVNEGLSGRWFMEFESDTAEEKRQHMRWSSFENSKSFWIQRETLIGLINDLGFDTVFEQFDSFSPDINTKLNVEYNDNLRGTFIGIRN